ncbi:hypothetical protein HXZ93_13560 [Acinetobacter pseudolwoffii]|uniref:hypothetical protein n=1 Tax=Acinetobacter pseudolwoffii TaxID=2053287 RepID=UPI002575EF52|nr:hypothetical protein [Acinetobacter pseudolwoffii]MDM1337019.1 hypothetical protein [Acinetobacter pseudolwoffii]
MKILIFSVGFFYSSLLAAFDIYGFIPWSIKDGNKIISNQAVVKDDLAEKGIKYIDVVYHNRMLTNGLVDNEKIKEIALESKPEVPISFDLEIGNRNKPETILPSLLAIIDLYHAYGGKAPIGVYATLPQNTFGGSKLTTKREAQLVQLNKQYEIIAKKIDFLSPVFYFYDGNDLDNWKKSVDFGMRQSHLYAKKYNLKIYPYITNSFRNSPKNPQTQGWTIELLDQKQMLNTLCYLKTKGADGAIIWASSQVVDANGVKPVINVQAPWFKGVQKFEKSCK